MTSETEMPTQSERNASRVRVEALHHATKTHPDHPAEQIVAAAQTYEEYLTGENTTKRLRMLEAQLAEYKSVNESMRGLTQRDPQDKEMIASQNRTIRDGIQQVADLQQALASARTLLDKTIAEGAAENKRLKSQQSQSANTIRQLRENNRNLREENVSLTEHAAAQSASQQNVGMVFIPEGVSVDPAKIADEVVARMRKTTTLTGTVTTTGMEASTPEEMERDARAAWLERAERTKPGPPVVYSDEKAAYERGAQYTNDETIPVGELFFWESEDGKTGYTERAAFPLLVGPALTNRYYRAVKTRDY